MINKGSQLCILKESTTDDTYEKLEMDSTFGIDNVW